MIQLAFRTVALVKRYPLAISRGTQAGSSNLFVFASDGSHEGVGELAPAICSDWTAERGQAQLLAFAASFDLAAGPHAAWAAMRARAVDPPAMAALDVALWDLLAKRAGLPLRVLLGLPRPSVPTSVTIGLNPPAVTRERVPEILRRTGARALKIKLGSPEGREHDRAHFAAAAEAAAPFGVRLRVDANGGWTVDEALAMDRWLAGRGVDYVEQPLAEGREDDLPRLFARRTLPIFADESCRVAADVPRLADRVDGVNLKLMKTGGLREALRMIHAARALGLRVMLGSMVESSLTMTSKLAVLPGSPSTLGGASKRSAKRSSSVRGPGLQAPAG